MQVVLNSNILLLAVTPQIFFFLPCLLFSSCETKGKEIDLF